MRPGDQHKLPGASYNPYADETATTPYTAREAAALQAKLDQLLGPEFLDGRPGPGGKKVTYLSGDKTINLANQIFGFNGWNSNIQAITTDLIEAEKDGKWTVAVSAQMRITLRDGSYREDLGYGSDTQKMKAAAFEKAKKSAVTDGLKRTFKQFGNAMGNCLGSAEYVKRIQRMQKPSYDFDTQKLHRHWDPPTLPLPETEKSTVCPKTETASVKTTPPDAIVVSSKSDDNAVQPGSKTPGSDADGSRVKPVKPSASLSGGLKHSLIPAGDTPEGDDEYGGDEFDALGIFDTDAVDLDFEDLASDESIVKVEDKPLAAPQPLQAGGDSSRGASMRPPSRPPSAAAGAANPPAKPGNSYSLPPPPARPAAPSNPAPTPTTPSVPTLKAPPFLAPETPKSHQPPVGFMSGRAVTPDGSAIKFDPKRAAFDPKLPTSIRRTGGIDHTKSSPLTRKQLEEIAPPKIGLPRGTRAFRAPGKAPVAAAGTKRPIPTEVTSLSEIRSSGNTVALGTATSTNLNIQSGENKPGDAKRPRNSL